MAYEDSQVGEDLVPTIAEVARQIGRLGERDTGLGLLEGVAMALAGTGLNVPVGEALERVAENTGHLSTAADDGCDKIASALSEVADGLQAIAEAIKARG